MVTIKYVWHDCFIVSLPHVTLLFDYWFDPGSDKGSLLGIMERIPEGIPLYVFVSHGHKDHFNPIVFGLAEKYPDVTYIISRDVAFRSRHRLHTDSHYKGPKVDASAVRVASEGDVVCLPLADVRVYGSTDAGNSYMVEAEGMRFFHAGDLNAWILAGMSEGERRDIRNRFRAVMDEIVAGELAASEDRVPSPIEAMMWPVDRRIGDDFKEGALEALRQFSPRRFIPMHFYPLEDVDHRMQLFGARSLAEDIPESSATEVVILSSPGDMIAFPRPGMTGN